MIKRFSFLFVLTLLVTSCSPTTQSDSLATESSNASKPPTATSLPPTATSQPITSDTGFDIVWSSFENAKSYTAHVTVVFQGPGGPMTDDINCQVDVVNQIALQTTDSSLKFLNNGRIATLFTNEGVYRADATGVYKPADLQTWDLPCQPNVEVLNITAADLKNTSAEYVGEVSEDGSKLYQYQIELSDNLLTKNPEVTVDGTPNVTVYVDSQSGFPARLSVTIKRLFVKSIYFDQYETTTIYSNWNSTDIQLPEVAQPGSTDVQTYSGQHANIFTFQFPVLDILSEYENGNLDLVTPDGDRLTWSTFPAWTLDVPDKDDEFKGSVCRSYASNMAVPSVQQTHPEATLEKAEWVKSDNLGFCKINLAITDGRQVMYVFNAPMDSVAQNMSLLDKQERATFMILVIPGSDEEPDSMFADVIQSIVFMK